MKEGSSVLKHYSLLTLCVLLVAGALCLSGPEAGAVNNGSGTTLHQTGPVASQVGQVMILHLSAETGPGEPYPDDIPASLARLGVERGDLLDGDNILVRVPDDELAAARMVAGSALQAYAPSARLAGQIRGQGGTVSVDVTVFQPEDKVSVALAVNRLGGTILNGETGSGSVLRLQIPEIHLESLSQLPNVVYIEPAVTYSLMNDRARDLVGAAPLSVAGWLSSLQPGLTGVGQIVGLADSGLDTGSIDDIHPDLASVPGERPKVVMLSSWAGAAVAADPDGHGTSMAATIAGTGAASSGRYQGLAPGASIYFQGLTNSSGQLDPPPDLGDLFEPAYAAGVRIHVDGWGGASGGYQDTASQTDHFIRLHPDFLVVFSAGNNGPNTGGLTPEAYSKNALVVGASQSPHPAFNPDQVDSGQVSDFSSRGPTSDGRLKPDLLAPGAVISAKARQVATEFDLGDGYYTYMEGTSMAAAVAGGSAALLREYFIKYEQQLSPTAALLKAALICGASTPVTGPSSDGFGTLDLGGTVLGLHEKTFNYVDDRSGLADGGTATYNCKVQGSGSPFKATLAWTDPSVLPGSVHPLVNNLDLVVKDPAGKLWLGNSFLTAGKPDDANNVEEVYIPQPEAGTYTVYVKGTSVVQNTVPGASQKSQDYALVYGQPLIRDVVQSVAKKVTLASGSEISLDNTLVSFEENGQIVNWPLSVVAPGATTPPPQSRRPNWGRGKKRGGGNKQAPAATPTPPPTHLAGVTWQAQGVQLIDMGESPMFTEIDASDRSGGFLFAPGASGRITVNGATLDDLGKLPPGVEVRAVINPSTQTVWSADVGFREVDGFLDRVDQEQQKIFLVGNSQPLTLAPDVPLAYLDEISDADPADIPFGAGASPSWDKLLPGLRMKLILSPDSDVVMYVGALRRLAVGDITGVEPTGREITLSSGSTYRVSPGVSVQLDDEAVDLAALKPGQHAIAVLYPENQYVLSLSAYSQVLYGQVVNVSTGQHSIDLIDDSNNFHELQFDGDTQFFRWGLPAGVDAVAAGSWVRLYLSPGSDQIRRLDLAEAAPKKTEVFRGYDPARQRLITDKGSYQLTDRTLVTKDGYRVAPADLIGGEYVVVTPLQASENGLPLLAAAAARTGPSATMPTLEVAAPWRGDNVIISGITSADRLYIYLPGEVRQTIPVVRGKRWLYSFQLETTPGAAGIGVNQAVQQGLVAQLVAVDTSTGGVAGQSITIPAQTGASLSDLAGHWAEADVEALLAQQLISGYADNTFRPDAPITRAEAGVILDEAMKIFAYNNGNNSFLQPSWDDWAQIPVWAQAPVAQLFNTGVLAGRTLQEFAPFEYLKRGEAAVAINRTMEIFRRV